MRLVLWDDIAALFELVLEILEVDLGAEALLSALSTSCWQSLELVKMFFLEVDVSIVAPILALCALAGFSEFDDRRVGSSIGFGDFVAFPKI